MGTKLIITRTCTVKQEVDLESYSESENGPMTLDEAIEYEKGLEGEEAFDVFETMVSYAGEEDIKHSVTIDTRVEPDVEVEPGTYAKRLNESSSAS